jgi:predicted Ser/Thr protein kinase
MDTSNLSHIWPDLVIEDSLGSGSFGQVYKAYYEEAKESIAVKMDYGYHEKSYAEYEADVMQDLNGQTGFPKLHFYREDCGFNLLGMELLGPSLEKYM